MGNICFYSTLPFTIEEEKITQWFDELRNFNKKIHPKRYNLIC